jgi:hypothetical protein
MSTKTEKHSMNAAKMELMKRWINVSIQSHIKSGLPDSILASNLSYGMELDFGVPMLTALEITGNLMKEIVPKMREAMKKQGLTG